MCVSSADKLCQFFKHPRSTSAWIIIQWRAAFCKTTSLSLVLLSLINVQCLKPSVLFFRSQKKSRFHLNIPRNYRSVWLCYFCCNNRDLMMIITGWKKFYHHCKCLFATCQGNCKCCANIGKALMTLSPSCEVPLSKKGKVLGWDDLQWKKKN